MYKFVFTAAFAAVLTLNVCVYAGSTIELRGELSVNGAGQSLLIVELVDQTRHQRIATTMAARDGSFRFVGIEPGLYELDVLDGGSLLKREMVEVREGLSGLVVRVDVEPRASTLKPAGPISVTKLRHKVPARAFKLFRSGSTEDLEKAVAIDPDYMEAQNNLGCRYLQAGDYGRALDHLRRAAELDPSSAMTYTNIAIAYIQEQRLDEAEPAVRKALQLGDTSGKANYVMAILLLRRGRSKEEAMRLLAAAADDFPPARTLLNRLK